MAAFLAGFQSQLLDHGRSVAAGTMPGVNGDFFEDERASNFKPAISPADATIVYPRFDDIVLTLFTFFEVPVCFQVEE